MRVRTGRFTEITGP